MEVRIDGVTKNQGIISQQVEPGFIQGRLNVLTELPEATRQELGKQDWLKTMIDKDDFPKVEVYFTDQERQKVPDYISTIDRNITALKSLFGFKRDDLTELKVFFDPLPVEHQYSNSGAFFTQDNKTQENQLWVKSSDMYGIGHELAHWLTVGDYSKYPDSTSLLLIEGIATWAAWQIKTPEEQLQAESGNDVIENYRKIIADGNANLFMKEEKVFLDGEFGEKPSRTFGGILFDVLYDSLDRDNMRFGDAWKTAGQYTSVREWVSSLGLSPEKIESEWKTRLNFKKEDDLRINSKNFNDE